MQLIGVGGGGVGNRGYEDNEHAFILSPMVYTFTYDWICILLRKVRGDGNKQVGVHISSKLKAIHPYHQS